MFTIVVLAGGTSPEREVSLRSGAAVARALEQYGHHVTVADPADDLDKLLPVLSKADVVFPALHGAGGEDGVLQAFLEAHHIAFVGSGSQASALCFDKARYTSLLQNKQIRTPATELVNQTGYQQSALSHRPFVLKPNDGGSSIDTFIVRNPATRDEAAIVAAFARYNQLLLQELIVGSEITVAVVGQESLPVIEIIPPSDQEFDYTNKYNGASQELCPPQHVAANLQTEASELAVRIHQLTGCQDMSRTDLMIDSDSQLYVLETNTIPGLTDQSLLPKAAATAGYSMADLCQRLVNDALERAA